MKGCKGRADVSYLGKLLCDKCWTRLSEKTPDEVKEILGVKQEKRV
jgi:hypothetical protein